MSTITLLSDFGLSGHYVAAMKGVILQTAPKATIVDITHQIEPQNLLQAAFVLRQVFDCFAAGTVHVVVVDPGVGTERRIIAARYSGRFLLAPDNGVASLVHRDFVLEELRLVQNGALFRKTPSITFHGRDIFAPVAAYIAKAHKLSNVGPPSDRLSLLPLSSARVESDGRIVGQVIYIDRFGNAVTNITGRDAARAAKRRQQISVRVAGRDIGPLRRTYKDVPVGEPVALIGSTDMLEVAVNQGNAAKALGITVGDQIVLT